MNNYTIITDSGCDLPPEKFEEWGVKVADLTIRFEGDEREYVRNEIDTKEFYDRMRAGEVASTAAVSPQVFRDIFEAELKAGNDVIYISFSSAISRTFQSGKMTADELSEEWPDRKIYAVDSLCASGGVGYLIMNAVRLKNEGMGIDELASYIENNRDRYACWFTVDDLVYLKRGGRVSGAAAFAAGVLDIKPVLHVDLEGHLTPVIKARGRKKSVCELSERYAKTLDGMNGGTYIISHGDCIDDALKLEEIIEQKTGKKAELICDIGPVIGAHSGPGTLALFFNSTEK